MEEYPILIADNILAALNAKGWLYEPVNDTPLSDAMWHILDYVQDHPGASTHQIAAHFGDLHTRMGGQLRRLGNRGLVTPAYKRGTGRLAYWTANDSTPPKSGGA